MGSEEYQIEGGSMQRLDLLQSILQQSRLFPEFDTQCLKTLRRRIFSPPNLPVFYRDYRAILPVPFVPVLFRKLFVF